MAEDLTPAHLRCAIHVSCPSIHRLEDGRLRVQGEFDRDMGVVMESGKGSEAAVIISPDLLSELKAEWVRGAVATERERCAKIADEYLRDGDWDRDACEAIARHIRALDGG